MQGLWTHTCVWSLSIVVTWFCLLQQQKRFDLSDEQPLGVEYYHRQNPSAPLSKLHYLLVVNENRKFTSAVWVLTVTFSRLLSAVGLVFMTLANDLPRPPNLFLSHRILPRLLFNTFICLWNSFMLRTSRISEVTLALVQKDKTGRHISK